MKQHITKKQWDELSEDERIIYFGSGQPNPEHPEENYPSIGQMIEFLGDDLWQIDNLSVKEWAVLGVGFKRNKELVDALWEAVKEKLNKL